MSDYEGHTHQIFGEALQRDLRNVKLCSIYPQDSKWFARCYDALLQVEYGYIQELIDGLSRDSVRGSFMEFGIFQGAWIDRLYQMTERAGLVDRPVYGFDSFQGLSAPHPQFDTAFWKEGMYAASKQLVEQNVRAVERPRIRLVEGWFRDSLKTPSALAIGEVAFARIDCDIYEPAKECLEYLAPRLSHGSILVFDDWTHDFGYGEGLAFAEWVEQVPHLRFEFLFLGPWDHLHLRVLHRASRAPQSLEAKEAGAGV